MGESAESWPKRALHFVNAQSLLSNVLSGLLLVPLILWLVKNQLARDVGITVFAVAGIVLLTVREMRRATPDPQIIANAVADELARRLAQSKVSISEADDADAVRRQEQLELASRVATERYNADQEERTVLRRAHALRELTPIEHGMAPSKVGDGTYFWIWVSGIDHSWPGSTRLTTNVQRTKAFNSIEIHRHHDASLSFLAYATPHLADVFSLDPPSWTSATVFCEPWQENTELVKIPFGILARFSPREFESGWLIELERCDQPPLSIVSAEWGAPGRSRDVTNVVRAHISDGAVDLMATVDVLGDVDDGEESVLHVKYSTACSALWSETVALGERLLLPPPPPKY